MILMNSMTGSKMVSAKSGIFRTVKSTPDNNAKLENISEKAQNFITIWNSNGGLYVPYNSDLEHAFLNVTNYTHITSPIRR